MRARLLALEKCGSSATAAASKGDGAKRLLVYGGWNREARRPDLLRELGEALESLGIVKHLDMDPYTTGPRRSQWSSFPVGHPTRTTWFSNACTVS